MQFIGGTSGTLAPARGLIRNFKNHTKNYSNLVRKSVRKKKMVIMKVYHVKDKTACRKCKSLEARAGRSRQPGGPVTAVADPSELSSLCRI